MKKLFLLFFVIIILVSCAGIKCYQMGNRFNNLTICVLSYEELQIKFNKYILAGYKRIPINNDGMIVNGFYIQKEHKIYCLKDFDILLHELWHASGNLKEPYWERRYDETTVYKKP